MLNSNLFRQIDYLPPGLTEVRVENLHEILPEPTLIHLPGRHSQPLFVSALLHGNEPVGLLALQGLLKKYRDARLPRALSIFIGNVKAAKAGLRRLDNQPDYNRIWPGTELPASAETLMTRQIVDEMARRSPFASIDIHNNTGLNPHYACVNFLESRHLQLASLFGRLVVYFIRPRGVQSAAFAPLCPAVTLECGKPGHEYGVNHAIEFLDGCMHLSEIPDHPVAPHDIDLFHTVAQITLRPELSFSFEEHGCDFKLDTDLDHMNFTEIPAGTAFGSVRDGNGMPLVARNEHGEEVTPSYFRIDHNRIALTKSVMPSMLTLDERIIRQDCLCYLMERISV